jgi:hypothetical protein
MLDTDKLYIVHSVYCQYRIPNTLITHMHIPTYDSFNDFYFMCAVFSSVIVDMFKSHQAVFCIILCNIYVLLKISDSINANKYLV